MGPQIMAIVRNECENNIDLLSASRDGEQQVFKQRIFDRLEHYKHNFPPHSSVKIEDVTNISPLTLKIRDMITALRSVVASFLGSFKGWFTKSNSSSAATLMEKVTVYSVFAVVAFSFLGVLTK